jgi:hypothetical protein
MSIPADESAADPVFTDEQLARAGLALSSASWTCSPASGRGG